MTRVSRHGLVTILAVAILTLLASALTPSVGRATATDYPSTCEWNGCPNVPYDSCIAAVNQKCGNFLALP